MNRSANYYSGRVRPRRMPEEEKVDNDRDKCGKTRYVRIQIWFRNLFQYRDYALYTSISMNVFRKHLGVLDLGVLDF